MKQFIYVLVLSFFVSGVSFAAEETALDQFFNNVDNFSADFNQVVVDADGSIIDSAEGNVWIARPGKFRWDYESPEAQQIIGDGETIWIYDVELEQVTKRNQQAALEQSPATILSGGSDIAAYFEVAETVSDNGTDWVFLTPIDPDSGFRQVRLGFVIQQLQQLVLIDQLEQMTRITFENIEENGNIDFKQFIFAIPEGVDIIEGG